MIKVEHLTKLKLYVNRINMINFESVKTYYLQRDLWMDDENKIYTNEEMVDIINKHLELKDYTVYAVDAEDGYTLLTDYIDLFNDLDERHASKYDDVFGNNVRKIFQ